MINKSLITAFIILGCNSFVFSFNEAVPKVKPAKPVLFKLARLDKPLILLETKVNKKGPFCFALDTGAGMTIISTKLAKKLKIKTANLNKVTATGAGGDVEICFGIVKSLETGGKQVERLEVAVMDLTHINKVVTTNIDGFIGYNFLKKFRITINYPRQMVTFE
jgi:predicted aspartyl protease